MFKKGTIFVCTHRLVEGGKLRTMDPGDTFVQSEDNKNPVNQDHRYGNAWDEYMKPTGKMHLGDGWSELLDEIIKS